VQSSQFPRWWDFEGWPGLALAGLFLVGKRVVWLALGGLGAGVNALLLLRLSGAGEFDQEACSFFL
jgi:hypothetical protein